MTNLSNRLIIILIIAFAAFYFAMPWGELGINALGSTQKYRLGLDLQGGVELDYKVDLETARLEPGFDESQENAIVESLKFTVEKRVQDLNINDSVITTASYGGDKHIIVQIPLKGDTREENNLNIQKAKEAIGRVMRIQFKEKRGTPTDRDYEERLDIANKALEDVLKGDYDFSINANIYKDSYENVMTGNMSGTLENLSQYFTLDEERIASGIYPNVINGNGLDSYTVNQDGQLVPDSEARGYWIIDVNNYQDSILDFDYIFVDAEPSEWIRAKDREGRVLDDRYFKTSAVTYDQRFNPQVQLKFDSTGAKIFADLTKRLVGKQIAIFVGGELLTAPNVNGVITGGDAVITGNYTPNEAAMLSKEINSGVVPAPIYLTSERTIDSKLGSNSLDKLIKAGALGFILIIVFLAMVYRVGGLLAGLALIIYTLIILAIVKVLGLILTLAGIAGLILSIGMAIDANILIFERLIQSHNAGNNLDDAIQEGFDKSWSAIWDANLTGIISAIILFIFGVNMIKGFGLMLGIGLTFSLFSRMYISRLFVVLASKTNMSLGLFLGLKDKKN